MSSPALANVLKTYTALKHFTFSVVINTSTFEEQAKCFFGALPESVESLGLQVSHNAFPSSPTDLNGSCKFLADCIAALPSLKTLKLFVSSQSSMNWQIN